MAAHDKALIIDSLSNRWSATSLPAAGTTATAIVSPARPTDRVVLQCLGWYVDNATLLTGTASTLSVNHRSITGSVVASWMIRPSNVGSLQDSWMVQYTGKKGVPLAVSWASPASSIQQGVSISGWFDSMTDG